MDIQVTSDWTFDRDYKRGFARTSDPRVLAVIEREDEYGGGHIDGDCYAPAFYWDRRNGGIESTAGSTFMDDESKHIMDRLVEARDRFYSLRKPFAVVERYLHIFHGTTMAQVSSTIDRDAQVVILNTPTWRATVGIEDEAINRFEVNSVTSPGQNVVKEIVTASSEDEAREIHLTNHADEGRYITVVERHHALTGDIAEWQGALDGDVFGIGWATLEERRLEDDEEIDLTDWNVEIEVWGFIGEDYAQESAARFDAGTPDLPPMLDFAA
jgi:hypothetical protein